MAVQQEFPPTLLSREMPLQQKSGADGWPEGVLHSRMTLGGSGSTNCEENFPVDQASVSSDNTSHKLPNPMMQTLKGLRNNLTSVCDEINVKINNLDRKIRNLNQDVLKMKEMLRQAEVKGRNREGNLYFIVY